MIIFVIVVLFFLTTKIIILLIFAIDVQIVPTTKISKMINFVFDVHFVSSTKNCNAHRFPTKKIRKFLIFVSISTSFIGFSPKQKSINNHKDLF